MKPDFMSMMEATVALQTFLNEFSAEEAGFVVAMLMGVQMHRMTTTDNNPLAVDEAAAAMLMTAERVAKDAASGELPSLFNGTGPSMN